MQNPVSQDPPQDTNNKLRGNDPTSPAITQTIQGAEVVLLSEEAIRQMITRGDN